MFKISTEEKSLHLIYLLSFWILMSIAFYVALFHDYFLPDIKSKHQVTELIEKQDAVVKEQNNFLPHLDSLNRLLVTYNPSTSQVYLESSINYELEELQKVYNANRKDENYHIFLQLDQFYSMQFFDKKAAWNSAKNAEYLKKNLEECEIGFQQKQNNLQLQEALKSQQQPQ